MANNEIGSFPDCFGNHTLGDLKCKSCPSAPQCLDKQAGFNLSGLLESCSRIIAAEEVAGGVPDLVFKLDEQIITDEDFETLKHDHPALFKWYMSFNGIPSG